MLTIFSVFVRFLSFFQKFTFYAFFEFAIYVFCNPAKKLKIDMVKRVIDDMLPRVQNLLCRKGAWFEKLLKD